MTDPKNLESWLHEKAGPAYDALTHISQVRR
jgi:hypothetical protein